MSSRVSLSFITGSYETVQSHCWENKTTPIFTLHTDDFVFILRSDGQLNREINKWSDYVEEYHQHKALTNEWEQLSLGW